MSGPTERRIIKTLDHIEDTASNCLENAQNLRDIVQKESTLPSQEVFTDISDFIALMENDVEKLERYRNDMIDRLDEYVSEIPLKNNPGDGGKR